MSYLGVHNVVIEKEDKNELTRDHVVQCICVGQDNSGFTVKGLITD